MTIKNISANYISSMIRRNNLNEYERSFPELFTHYFTYWANRDSFHTTLREPEVSERLELIWSKIPYLEKQFELANIDIANIEVVLFVGEGTANGHAFRFKDKFIAWIPIETYHIEQLCAPQGTLPR